MLLAPLPCFPLHTHTHTHSHSHSHDARVECFFTARPPPTRLAPHSRFSLSCLGQAKLFSDALLQLFPLDSPITASPSGRPVCNHRSTLCAPKARPKVSTTRESVLYQLGPAAHAPPRRSAPQLRPTSTQVPHLSSPWGYVIRPNFTHPHRDSQTPSTFRFTGQPAPSFEHQPGGPRISTAAAGRSRNVFASSTLPSPWTRRWPFLWDPQTQPPSSRFFPSLCAKLNPGKASYRPPQEDPS
ncbi:hypothetical protein CORC01_07771 [Colletotrichum orchidophilum]|uniref:Uncharacterized protein n=1 Tax=Colletotrichum orchidophilum TaxID=1209926 RepID=A0A1G4B6M6_9PEZI|nr:uncharacterized protein CORC01_07771 [Colletotrichum orchidophilum]OHE96986.1 hypothetical protein CORC01_07771 [Colletotrichum orchidophilum]